MRSCAEFPIISAVPQTTASPDSNRISAAGWRIVLLASLGGTLEFYDFVIFGIFAKDIADAIFPNPTPLVSLMVSFAAFAAGYLARPIGGIVLSHFGDRFGRRRVLLISIFVMSGATLGMGLVPTFAVWGAAASALMVALRLVQGFCLGGELPGALTYVVETAPRQAPFVCTVVFSCVTMGVAAATGVSLAVRTWLPPALVPSIGWRIAFVIGGLGGLLSFALRRSLEESPEFARMKALASRRPFGELLRTHLSSVVVGVASLAATAGFTGLYFAHTDAYMSGVLGYSPRQPDAAAGDGGRRRRAGQRLVRGAPDRSLPDPRPLQRRRARVQRRLHRVQRHGAAGGDQPDPVDRHEHRPGAGDGGMRVDHAHRQPVADAHRRPCTPVRGTPLGVRFKSQRSAALPPSLKLRRTRHSLGDGGQGCPRRWSAGLKACATTAARNFETRSAVSPAQHI